MYHPSLCYYNFESKRYIHIYIIKQVNCKVLVLTSITIQALKSESFASTYTNVTSEMHAFSECHRSFSYSDHQHDTKAEPQSTLDLIYGTGGIRCSCDARKSDRINRQPYFAPCERFTYEGMNTLTDNTLIVALSFRIERYDTVPLHYWMKISI